MDPSDLVGERLFGEYTIVKPLGEGTIGSVYLARHDSIGKEIAVKVLHKKSAQDDETVQRFEREALAISLLSHPNLIRVLIFGRTDKGLLYLAMEYVEGLPLNQVIKDQELEERRVVKIFKQLCDALGEAHEMGIIHRDLKPANILLTEKRGEADFVKVLDFGMAKFIDNGGHFSQEKLSKSGIVYGTPAYVSPEQAQALELDHRTDIYSLGCILYEAVTGQRPFPAKTAVKMLSAHVYEEPAPPSEVAPGQVSPSLERVIYKAMAKEPEARFQDAHQMYAALEAVQRELEEKRGLASTGEVALSTSGHRRQGGGDAQAAALSVGRQKSSQTNQSKELVRALIWAIVGAVVMLICVLVVVVGVVVLG